MTKHKIRTVALLLTVLMLFALFPASADEQSDMEALQSRRDELAQDQAQLQDEINALRSDQNAVVKLKTALDSKSQLTLRQISLLKEQRELLDKHIREKSAELDGMQLAANDQFDRYCMRLREMEESGPLRYLYVLLGATGIMDLLSRIDDIRDIMRYDRTLLADYLDSVRVLENAKTEYEAMQAEAEEKSKELEGLSKQLQSDIDEATALIVSMQNDINANAAQMQELKLQRDAAEAQLRQLVGELNEETEPSGESATIATGTFLWPSDCPSISSPYGYRDHPIYGTYMLHSGLDVGAAYSTPIYATDGGEVVISQDGWNGGWGNYVMIDHGNNVQSLYAHMSSRAVSFGEVVTQGQIIGYVGSTGASTGAHLHFEIWVNGTRTDPAVYFGGAENDSME